MMQLTQYEAAVKKRLRLSAIIICIFCPIIIALGVLVFKQKLYVLMSILMLILVMIPFFMVFEKRRPRTREIVLIVTMSALVICLNLICNVVLPVLKIGTALVIISGIGLGPEAGFLIGALSRFVLNFYVGQGMWTPWQMFCWGILGFLAGLFFAREDLESMSLKNIKGIIAPLITLVACEILAYASYLIVPEGSHHFGWRMYVFGLIGIVIGIIMERKKLPANCITVSIFTLFTVVIIYGGIMNMATATVTSGVGSGLNIESLRALYISGLPYDISHAVSAAICAFFLSQPIISKLERIKVKYGIYR